MAHPFFLPHWGLCVFRRLLPLALSPLRVSHILTRVRQIRCTLLLQRTRCCALQVPRVCDRCGLRTHSSRSPSHGGVIFYSLSSTSSCASLLSRQPGSPAWSFRSSSAGPTTLDPYRPISRLMRFQSFRAPVLCSYCAPHSATSGPFPGWLPLGCRRHGLQSRGLLAPPPP